MQNDRRRRLALVPPDGQKVGDDARNGGRERAAAAARDIDWAILMARAQDGDTDAYLRLLQEITPYIRSLARRWHKDHWDIEDIVQDSLLTLHSIRHTYDPSRPFGPWLVGIANRRAIDRLRRYGRQAAREATLTAEHEASMAAEDGDDDVFERQRLTEAVAGLPSVQRTAVDLLKLQEMSLQEASDRTGLSIASLKMATHRALQTLRGLLSDRREP